MPGLTSYLFFDGQCEAAFQFYAEKLDGKLMFASKYGDAPGCEGMDAATKARMMHAALQIGDRTLLASDCPPGQYERPQGFHLLLTYPSPEQAESVFAALSEGGRVKMPMAETFWAQRFGMAVDRFGVPWMVSCDKEQQEA